MIDRASLLKELEVTEAQRERTVAELYQIEGAMRTLRHLLGKVDRAENEAKARLENDQETDGQG